MRADAGRSPKTRANSSTSRWARSRCCCRYLPWWRRSMLASLAVAFNLFALQRLCGAAAVPSGRAAASPHVRHRPLPARRCSAAAAVAGPPGHRRRRRGASSRPATAWRRSSAAAIRSPRRSRGTATSRSAAALAFVLFGGAAGVVARLVVPRQRRSRRRTAWFSLVAADRRRARRGGGRDDPDLARRQHHGAGHGRRRCCGWSRWSARICVAPRWHPPRGCCRWRSRSTPSSRPPAIARARCHVSGAVVRRACSARDLRRPPAGRGGCFCSPTFAAAAVTSRLGLRRKALLGIAEERGGRRGAGNAIANTGVAAVAALLGVADLRARRRRWSDSSPRWRPAAATRSRARSARRGAGGRFW